MYAITIDCISIKEIDLISTTLNYNFWNGPPFSSKNEAVKLAEKAKSLAPFAEILVVAV